MSDFNSFLENATHEEAELALQLASDIQTYENLINPLTKFNKTNHPNQLKLYNDFVTGVDNKSYFFNLCGNRWGKTFLMSYIIAVIGTNSEPRLRHKPSPFNSVVIWVIGETYDVIEEVFHRKLIGFLREDQYEVVKRPNIKGVIIRTPEGGKTEVLYKPLHGDTSKKFEGAEPHYVFVDEAISEEEFKSINSRCAGNNMQYMQCYTRLHSHAEAGWITSLEEEAPDSSLLGLKKYCYFMHGSIYDNKNLNADEVERFVAGYSSDKDPQAHQARIYGNFIRPVGCVFNYKASQTNIETGEIIHYNDFNFYEYYEARKQNLGTHILLHDHGFAKPSVWLLAYIHYPTGTTYFIDEIYEARLPSVESAQKCYEMLRRWKVEGEVKKCIADKAILHENKQDTQSSATNIEAVYRSATYQERDPDLGITTEVRCFPEDFRFICQQAHKLNINTGLEWVRLMIETDNPHTNNKPFYRFSPRCVYTKKELKCLKWSLSGQKETTTGENHAVDCIRYYTVSRFRDNAWLNRHNENDDFNAAIFQKSRGSYFRY